MRRLSPLFALVLLCGATIGDAADPRIVYGVSGAPITSWSEWVAKKGPVAALVWASWAPGAEETINGHAELEKACTEAGFHLVVLDVQETLEDARKALNDREVEWLHDRHGTLLKNYRVIKVPSLLLVGSDGEAVARLAPTAAAVRDWSGS